ncbi:hypothetical protein F5B20DRAFT_560246 [Whalleya microplaca]|nr:hypothetical protein F5B20DRAFT_560246 [Whalleya microplaca]
MNPANATTNIVTTLSSLVNNLDLSDNTEAAMLPGNSFKVETCIHVRWRWITIVLPKPHATGLLSISNLFPLGGTKCCLRRLPLRYYQIINLGFET